MPNNRLNVLAYMSPSGTHVEPSVQIQMAHGPNQGKGGGGSTRSMDTEERITTMAQMYGLDAAASARQW